ncbi:MAG TPA: class I SAM-dependent methyltransferase [Phototrophicaceae bacterium]|nr:class I SAM-dependent methyltransferase [Phototrophicaceae bacterium]
MAVWASGAAYEAYIGRWSRPVAREFLSWLAVPAQSVWLDLGCGTGVLSQTILAFAAPRQVQGVDRSEAFIGYARQQVVDSRVSFRVGDAQSLTDADATYQAAISGLVLNFVPAPDRMIAEMMRVTQTGGTVAVYVWDYADQMQMLRYFWDAAVMLDPAARDLDEGRRRSICNPEALSALFREAGLSHIETRAIDVPTIFTRFDDYWLPFLGGNGPAPTYITSLSEEHRTTLRERLRSQLPIETDGSIHLTARAWGIRGIVSG